MVFVQQEKERVPWYLMSNTGPTGLESRLEQENLALLLALNFTPAKSCVPKSSSCKKHFLHLCCANEETSVYEGKQISWDIYLKYKWPADGWAHHAWHPLRFCPFISLWRRQLCCLHSTFLMSFHNSHEGNTCSKHQAAGTSETATQTHGTQALQGSSAAPSQSIKPRGSKALSSSRAPSLQPEKQQRHRDNAGLMGSSEQAGMQGAEQQWHYWELAHSPFLNKDLIF